MGDVADMMLDGTLCASCGEYLWRDTGYPVYCRGCQKDQNASAHKGVLQRHQEIKKVNCPTCGKRVKAIGLADHQRDAHGSAPTTSSAEQTK